MNISTSLNAIKLLLSILMITAFGYNITNAQNYEWAKNIGSSGDDRGNSITTDASGNVYTTGHFIGTVDFDPGTGTTNLTSAGGKDIFITKLDAAGNLIWAKNMGGTSNDVATSIVIDASGNVYTAGNFEGTADFDPGTGITNLTSAGSFDIFISKLDAAGNFVWAKNIGGISYAFAKSIAIDVSGSVYTTGYFGGTADFNPGTGINNLTSAGGSDIFISKLDATGNFIWAKNIGGISADGAESITLDASGNVYTAGYFEATVDFDPGTGTSNLTSTGFYDIFITKLDATGNFVWAKSMDGAIGYDLAHSIAVDASENVYTSGYFEGTVDFDPGTGITNLTSAGGRDIFISKLDAIGNFVWAKNIEGTNNDEANSITLDDSGNIYAVGYFNGTVDFDPGVGITNLTSVGGSDIFISKLDTAGNFVWAKNIGGTSADEATSIAIDILENIYTTGSFEGAVDFDPGTGTDNLTSVGSYDIFISKLSQNVLVSSITVQGLAGASTITANAGTLQMEATVFPAAATDATYTWSVANGTGSATINTSGMLTAIIDGTVTITATANDTSGVTGSTVITISNQSTGINEQNTNHNLSIYPNPVNTQLTIDSDMKIESIMIIDVSGKILETITLNNSIDVFYLTKGIYFLQIQTDKGLVSTSFIKE